MVRKGNTLSKGLVGTQCDDKEYEHTMIGGGEGCTVETEGEQLRLHVEPEVWIKDLDPRNE
jgi:hypothetical protein